MKGVSELVSHGSLLLISIIATGLLVSGISDYLFDTEKTITRTEMENMANLVQGNILDIYYIANSSSDYFSGKILLPVAEKVGNKRMMIEGSGKNFTMTVGLKNEEIKIKRILDIDVNITGAAYFPAYMECEKINENIDIRLVE